MLEEHFPATIDFLDDRHIGLMDGKKGYQFVFSLRQCGKGAQHKEACAGKEIFGIWQPTTCEPVVGKEISTTRIFDDQQLDEFLHASTIRILDDQQLDEFLHASTIRNLDD